MTTSNFRTHIAQQFLESITEPANNIYYVCVGKHIPYTDDNTPEAVQTSVYYTHYKIYDDMLFGKKVSSNNTTMMVKRHNWTTNTVYTQYDDRTEDLENKNFFVCVNASTEYHVFKCLNNDANTVSTVAPAFSETSADDDFYFTSDGYHWKYMYTVDSTTFNRFATTDYIPVTPNANVSGNAISGAIDVVLVENGGSRYNSYANGYIQESQVGGNTLIFTIESTAASNASFYDDHAFKIVDGTGAGQQRTIQQYIISGSTKRVVLNEEFVTVPDLTSKYEISPNVVITGDGVNCVARALVNSTSNTIHSVEITNKGSGYTYCTATVAGNTGILSSNTLVVANNAVLRPIIGPKNGHGSNVYSELYSEHVGMTVTLANTENATIPTHNSYRTVSIIKDPKFANVELTLTSISGTFTDAETILQATSNATGIVTSYDANNSILRLSNTTGLFIAANTLITGQTSNATANVVSYEISGVTKNFDTFDQTYKMGITLNSVGGLTENEEVY